MNRRLIWLLIGVGLGGCQMGRGHVLEDCPALDPCDDSGQDQIDKLQGEHWFAPVFLVSRFAGEPRILEPHKHDGLAWFPLDAMPDPLTRSTIVALDALREAGPTNDRRLAE